MVFPLVSSNLLNLIIFHSYICSYTIYEHTTLLYIYTNISLCKIKYLHIICTHTVFNLYYSVWAEIWRPDWGGFYRDNTIYDSNLNRTYTEWFHDNCGTERGLNMFQIRHLGHSKSQMCRNSILNMLAFNMCASCTSGFNNIQTENIWEKKSIWTYINIFVIIP